MSVSNSTPGCTNNQIGGLTTVGLAAVCRCPIPATGACCCCCIAWATCAASTVWCRGRAVGSWLKDNGTPSDCSIVPQIDILGPPSVSKHPLVRSSQRVKCYIISSRARVLFVTHVASFPGPHAWAGNEASSYVRGQRSKVDMRSPQGLRSTMSTK